MRRPAAGAHTGRGARRQAAHREPVGYARHEPMLFDRLAAGRGCSTHTVERVGEWLERLWPRESNGRPACRGTGARRSAAASEGAAVAPGAFPALQGLPEPPQCGFRDAPS